MQNKYQSIAIWGWGKEGKAGFAYLHKLYPDARFTILEGKADVSPDDLPVVTGENIAPVVASGQFDLILKSPGVSLYKPEILEARKKGTQFTSGTNIWFEMNAGAKTIAVTGTKGKSTTSSLIYHLLREAGADVTLAGNIGLPLLEAKAGKDMTVLELSSYQIADLHHAPDYAVLTNLYTSHVEWHGSIEQYHADKLRMFSLSPDTKKILPKEFHDRLSHFSNAQFFEEADIDISIPASLNLPHYRKNIAAALKVLECAGYKDRIQDDSLSRFKPLPHRQEIVGEINSITFVNDSIATIPESTLAALNAFSGKNLTLLIGGQEQNQDYSCLVPVIRSQNIKILYLPDNGIRIQEFFQSFGISGTVCADLSEAVCISKEITSQGGVVLMSPGAPSYGRFKNFEERGETFRKAAGF